MITCKRSTIPLHIRFLLTFVPYRFSTDVGANGDASVTLGYKILFGKMYILSEITAEEPLDVGPVG